MGAKKPVIHARDHLPGGADPLKFDQVVAAPQVVTPFSETLLAQGPDAVWPLDDAPGSGGAAELTGTYDPLTRRGTSVFGSDASPAATSSFYTSGSSASGLQYVAGGVLPHLPILTGDYCYGVWVKAVDWQTFSLTPLIAYHSSTGTGAFEFQWANSGGDLGKIWCYTTGATLVSDDVLLPIAPIQDALDFVLIGVQREGSEMSMWINGVKQAVTGTDTLTVHPDNILVGLRDGGPFASTAKGKYSYAFRIARALNTREWLSLFTSTTPTDTTGFVPVSDGSGGYEWEPAPLTYYHNGV